MEPSGFEGRGGALVEEAKKLMQDDDDDAPGAGGGERAGPKIKMNRIGKKGKKAAAGGAVARDGSKGPAPGLEDYQPTKGGGAFTE